MISWFKQNRKALAQSSAVFAILVGSLIILVGYYDFSDADLGGLLFLTSLLCCIFVAKNTFDSVKESTHTVDFEGIVYGDTSVSSEELYTQLYKNSPVPYLIIDYDGHVKSANISAVRLLGSSQDKVKGINIFSRLQSDKLEHLDFLIEKYRNGVAVSDEMVMVKKPDKRESWALLSLFSCTSMVGQKIGLLTLVDITKQKKPKMLSQSLCLWLLINYEPRLPV